LEKSSHFTKEKKIFGIKAFVKEKNEDKLVPSLQEDSHYNGRRCDHVFEFFSHKLQAETLLQLERVVLYSRMSRRKGREKRERLLKTCGFVQPTEQKFNKTKNEEKIR